MMKKRTMNNPVQDRKLNKVLVMEPPLIAKMHQHPARPGTLPGKP